MFGDFLGFVAYELLGFVVIVLALVIALVLALISSISRISRSVQGRFLVAVFEAVSTLFAKETGSSLHEVLTFFWAKSVYDGVNIHSHGIAISLGLELIRTTVLGVWERSSRVVFSHQLGLTPIVVESNCFCHLSSK